MPEETKPKASLGVTGEPKPEEETPKSKTTGPRKRRTTEGVMAFDESRKPPPGFKPPKGWDPKRLSSIERRTTAAVMAGDKRIPGFKASEKWQEMNAEKQERIGKRSTTIPETAPSRWVMVDKSFESRNGKLKLEPFVWVELTAIQYDSAKMYSGHAYGMITAPVGWDPSKVAKSTKATKK